MNIIQKLIARLIYLAIDLISRYKTKQCYWCNKVTKVKKRWIFSKNDPVGSIIILCDQCAICCKRYMN